LVDEYEENLNDEDYGKEDDDNQELDESEERLRQEEIHKTHFM